MPGHREGPSIDGKWTDLEIRCQDRTFRVHRAVVCSKSAVLAEQCEVITEAAHGNANVIEHHAFDAQTVEYMLRWMYEEDYSLAVDSAADDHSISMSSSDECSSQLVIIDPAEPKAKGDALSHVHVYAIARFYQLPKLLDLALEKFACADTIQQLDNFPGVLCEVYKHTTSVEDPLPELEAKLLNEEGTVESLRDQVRIKTGEVGTFELQLKESAGEQATQSRQLAQLTRDLETREDAFSAIKQELTSSNRALQMSNSVSQVKQEQAEAAIQKLKQTNEKYKAAANEASYLKQLSQQQAKEIERFITADQNVAASTAQVFASQAKVMEGAANLFTAKSMENAAKAVEQKLQDIIEDAIGTIARAQTAMP
ncbi:hypothetical protein LTS14_005767 [Recurvomyces mirabilis]|uniref:uncharacterized protein n=1 Tax=Recurvomyces mirabilis TaxID=574656 RepID=UPI002DE09DF2|nr:hypothetical protein LTS14_005767 [Recurvomyces mirabilis]